MLHTLLSFFENQPFQTHDPTQLTENNNDPLPTQPNPARGSTQPTDNSETLHLHSRHVVPRVAQIETQNKCHKRPERMHPEIQIYWGTEMWAKQSGISRSSLSSFYRTPAHRSVSAPDLRRRSGHQITHQPRACSHYTRWYFFHFLQVRTYAWFLISHWSTDKNMIILNNAFSYKIINSFFLQTPTYWHDTWAQGLPPAKSGPAAQRDTTH